MSLIWSSCCQDNPCKPDCVVLYRDDIKYRGAFNRLFHPAERYQSDPVTDSENDNDDLPDGTDKPYIFNGGKITLWYTSSSDTFIRDGVVDNVGLYLPIDITWSNEDQEYQEEFTITLGSLVIQGITTGYYVDSSFNYETTVYVNSNKVYYASNNLYSIAGVFGTVIDRIPQYIIRYNNRAYYIVGDTSIYETADNSGLTGTVRIAYSFVSYLIDSGSNNLPTQTTITFGAEGTSTQRKYPIIWRPDKWQNFQEFQTFSSLTDTSDQTLEAITAIRQNDKNERNGCLQPSKPAMVEKGVTFPRCFPPVAIKFSGFKNSSNIIIPGRILYSSDGQYPTYNIADINAEAQTQFIGMTGEDNRIRWINGATVSFDYSAVENIVLNAMSGDENTILFEPMNPIDVMTNYQANYGIRSVASYNQTHLTGYHDEYHGFTGESAYNVLSDSSSLSISTEFKHCRVNPFDYFNYTFKEDGSYTVNDTTSNAFNVDNGFQLKDVTLTVFKGVVAPSVYISLAPNGKFNFVFERSEPYLAQEDIDKYNRDQLLIAAELRRAGEITAVTTTGISTGITITSSTLNANFSDFLISESKKDNRPVFILQYEAPSGNPEDKLFKYTVTDKYGATSTGTITIHFDSSAPSLVTKFFESEDDNFTGLDYDLICKVTATPSMVSYAYSTGDLIELYYVHPGKQLEANDLINTQLPNKARYYSFQNKIIHNFQLNQNIVFPKWISWGGIKQDTIYAEFIAPSNNLISINRYALYNEYSSFSGTLRALTVDHCVLSVSIYEGTIVHDPNDYTTTSINWIQIPDVIYSVHLNPEPITSIECVAVDNNPGYTGVGHFLAYTDPYTGDETWINVPFSATPPLPYNLVSPVRYNENWDNRITRITDNTVPVIKGIRVDSVTVHYTDSSSETVDLSTWNDTGDSNIK